MTSSVTGRPYSELPTAYLYKQSDMSRPPACGCNAAQNFEIIAGNPPSPEQSQAETRPAPFIPVPVAKPDPGADPETLANAGRRARPRGDQAAFRQAGDVAGVRAAAGPAQGQGRRASVPSRPSSGNRSASSGPEDSPVRASLSGMNSALPLRPVASLTLPVQSFQTVAVPRFLRQQIEGLAQEIAVLVGKFRLLLRTLAQGCATSSPHRSACRDCRAPPARTARPGRRRCRARSAGRAPRRTAYGAAACG